MVARPSRSYASILADSTCSSRTFLAQGDLRHGESQKVGRVAWTALTLAPIRLDVPSRSAPCYGQGMSGAVPQRGELSQASKCPIQTSAFPAGPTPGRIPSVISVPSGENE